MFERLNDNIWRHHDAAGCTCYLVVGEERAAMIDCGGTGEPVMAELRAITPLPVDLLLTHAHPDHFGAAYEFDRVWLHQADAAVLDEFEQFFACLNIAPIRRETLHTFADGHVFPLGGRSLTAIHLPGHTPGSSVFADDAGKCLFTGDALGSGDFVLMSLPRTDCLSRYRENLMTFLDRTADRADYTWHAGHYHQAQRPDGTVNPPCRRLCEDMASLCGKILSGQVQGKEVQEAFAPNGKALRADDGTAGIIYNRNQQC
ncbi:MAG: MBL fold metallo-hydrolase [Clostridia bacterium]|nr:MBL fold metallo-hydrolase [Clostridia bacterium]